MNTISFTVRGKIGILAALLLVAVPVFAKADAMINCQYVDGPLIGQTFAEIRHGSEQVTVHSFGSPMNQVDVVVRGSDYIYYFESEPVSERSDGCMDNCTMGENMLLWLRNDFHFYRSLYRVHFNSRHPARSVVEITTQFAEAAWPSGREQFENTSARRYNIRCAYGAAAH